jgi:hypothetical protein
MKTDLTPTHECCQRFNPMMWIRIGFKADPDPVAKQLRIHVDPDPGRTLKAQKLEFYMDMR